MLTYLRNSIGGFKNIVEETINAESKGRILKYFKLLNDFTARKLDAQTFIEHAHEILLSRMDRLKSMNFANLVLMLHDCCESDFLHVITEERNLHLLLEIVELMSQVNNLASKKLALFIKFVDSCSSSIFSNNTLLRSLEPEDFQASSWVPEMSLEELYQIKRKLFEKYANDQELCKIKFSSINVTDVKELHEARLQTEAYNSRLIIDNAFFQGIVQSFLPLGNTVNPLDPFLNQAKEILANINNLLVPQCSGKETYQILEKNFIERYHKPDERAKIEALIDSCTEQKELANVGVQILSFISNIQKDYQLLINLSKQENIQNSPDKALTDVFEWSQQIKNQFDGLSLALSETEPKNHHFQLSTDVQTHIIRGETDPKNHHFQSSTEIQTHSLTVSNNGALPSSSETGCPHCDKVLYSNGFLKTHLNLERAGPTQRRVIGRIKPSD